MVSLWKRLRAAFRRTGRVAKRLLSPGGAAASPRRKRGRPRGSGRPENWRQHVTLDMTYGDMMESVCAAYDLDPGTTALWWRQERPELKAGFNQGYVCSSDDPDEGVRAAASKLRVNDKGACPGVKRGRPLRLDELGLCVVRRKGEVTHVDTNCDGTWLSKCLLEEVGPAIRHAYHWVPPATPIRLQMDNAGGHGTKEDVEFYVSELKKRFNIIVCFQPPNSPESNVLDLGTWMSIQSDVDKMARGVRQNADALESVVMNAWHQFGEGEGELKLAAVWEKLEDVAREAIALGGDNTGREGAGAGARARVRARYEASGFLKAPSSSSSSSEDEPDADVDSDTSDDE